MCCFFSLSSSYITITWLERLAAAGANFGLHLLKKNSNSDETMLDFGGGISGHHGKINDMTFCGGGGPDSARYVGTVSGTVTLGF